MEGNKEELGRRLSELRQGFSLSQENVAAYLGVDQTLVSKIESGERNIDSYDLESLADLYMVSVDDILNGTCENRFSVSFRKDTYSQEDLFALAQINRIVMNQDFMDGIDEKD